MLHRLSDIGHQVRTALGWDATDGDELTARRAQIEAICNPSTRRKLLAVAEITSDWIWMTDATHRFVYLSPQIAHHLGLEPRSLIGRRRDECMADGESTGYKFLSQKIERHEEFRNLQYSWRGLDGREHFVEVSGKPIWDEGNSFAGYLGSGRSITDRLHQELALLRAHETLRLKAETDPLTELYNRAYFNNRIEELCLQTAFPFLVILIDLDRFKKVNDTFGHHAGDELLKHVSKRLRKAVRKSDSVCRLGGDEFAILVNADTTPDVAEAIAERLLASLQEPFEIDGMALNISASIGINGLDPNAEDRCPELLLQSADASMYAAKHAGRSGAVCFGRHVQDDQKLANRLVFELEETIRNRGLTVHYQPIVTLPDRRINGLEALVRWPRSDGSFTPPGRFIPVAEENGLMPELGDLVLDIVLQDLAEIPSEIYVTLNLSVRQLETEEFADRVLARIEKLGIRLERLYFEVTESVCLDPDSIAFAQLARLRSAGAFVVLDDFGAGHSSLTYLRSFWFSKIKLDREFLRDADEDARAQAILVAITALAKSLGTPIVAEGVETEAQCAIVTNQGIEEAQGYLFCRPVPLAELSATLQPRSPDRDADCRSDRECANLSAAHRRAAVGA